MPRDLAKLRAWKQANRAKINAQQREYHQRHKTERSEKRKATYALNGEKERQYQRDRRAADPEAALEYQRQWAQHNPEKVRAKSKRWYDTHQEAAIQKTTAWIKAHPEQARQYSRIASQRRRDTDPDAERARIHAWIAAHPEQARRITAASSDRRRVRQHGLPATFTRTEEAFCRSHFHYACAACGNQEGFQWTIAMDHWIPVASPVCPGSVVTNMIPLCHGLGSCNNTKHDKAPESWLIQRFGKRKAATILKRIHAYFALVAPQEEMLP